MHFMMHMLNLRQRESSNGYQGNGYLTASPDANIDAGSMYTD